MAKKHTLAYNLMKRIIDRGDYDKADVLNKLDAYLAADRITAEEYSELMALVEGEDE